MKLLDTQKYWECQLVSVINAAVYLGEPRVEPNSEEYERLVDLVGARHGSAIRICDAVRYLRLVEHKIHKVTKDKLRSETMNGRPVQVVIDHPTVGLHGVLITDDNGKSVRVWNLRRKAFPHDRLSWPRLIELMAGVPQVMRWAEWYELDPLRIREKPNKK